MQEDIVNKENGKIVDTFKYASIDYTKLFLNCLIYHVKEKMEVNAE